MTPQWRGRSLWIGGLSVAEMGRLAACAPRNETEAQVLAALLAGARVCVPRDGLEYRQYRKTAPFGLYRRLVALERELREMGIVVVRNSGGKPLGDKKISPAGGAALPAGASERER